MICLSKTPSLNSFILIGMLILSNPIIAQPTIASKLAFWREKDVLQQQKKCEQPGMMLTQKCFAQQLLTKVKSLEKETEGFDINNHNFESLKDTVFQIFLTGRNIYESKNIKFIQKNLFCQLLKWELEALKFKHQYYQLHLETLKKEEMQLEESIQAKGKDIDSQENETNPRQFFDDSNIQFSNKQIKGNDSPLGGLQRSVSQQVLSKKRSILQEKYTNQQITGTESILQDVKIAISNMKKCLDEKEIAKLDYKQ